MEKKLVIIKNCLAEVLNYLVLLAIEITLFYGFIRIRPGAAALLLPVVIPLLFYGVRCKVQGAIIFFCLHLLPCILIFSFFGGLAEKLVFTAAAIFQALLSCSIRFKKFQWESNVIYPPAFIGTAVVLYLADSAQGSGEAGNLLVIIVFFYLMLYFIYWYFKNFLHYMEISQKTTRNIPIRQIFFAELVLVGGFVGASLLTAMLGLNKELIKMLVNKIWLVIRAVLRFLFSLLPDAVPEEEQLVEEAVQRAGGMEDLVMPEESGILGEILDVLFTLGTMVLLVVCIIAGIRAAVKFIRWVFAYRQRKPAGSQEAAGGDIVEKISRQETKSTHTRLSLWLTPEERIRRIFFHTLLKKYKLRQLANQEQLLRLGTARECMWLFSAEKQEEALKLISLYEKARYGQGGCTPRDIKEARRLAARL